MIGLSYEEIVSKIKEKKGLSEDEINSKIKEKRNKLSGLVSPEGAAYIIANELGLDLMQSVRERGLKINKLQAGMRVGVLGKVMKMYEVRSFNKNGRSGKVGSFLIGDDTGYLRIVLWDANHIKLMEDGSISDGKIMKISSGNVRINQGYKEMHLGNYSQMEIDPEGFSVEVIKREDMQMEGPSYEMKKLSNCNEGDNVSVYCTIVQVFEPRFYEGCAECGKKVESKCEQHPGGAIKKIPVLNFYVDDGSDVMRAVAFRDQVTRIVNLADEELVKAAENTEGFDALKDSVLGEQMIFSGKININNFLNRKEFIIRSINNSNKEILTKVLGE